MDKMVIYKMGNTYYVTTKENYYCRIQNARRIQNCGAFDTAEEIIQYYCKHFGSEPEDFEVIE